mgnify:CR=1 FL=1
MVYKVIEPNFIEKACFGYLNDLKEDNLTHLIKAITLQKKFSSLKKEEAEKIIRWWATNYNKDGNYRTIVI